MARLWLGLGPPGMHPGVNLPNRAALGAAFRELGPLRPIAVYVAVASTVGSLLLVARLPQLARLADGSSGDWLVAVAVVATAIAGALALPSALAFAAGYCFGGLAGATIAVVGGALGAWLGQRVVWPRLGSARFAWMRHRPRAGLVRRLCVGEGAANPLAASLGVARLRWAARVPNAVGNLLLAVVEARASDVLLGSVLGALPAAGLAAWAGSAWRRWRELGETPPVAAIVAATAAAAVAGALLAGARRAWRAAAAP